MTDLNWLPWKLPNNAKFIISGASDSILYSQFKSKCQADNCITEVSLQIKYFLLWQIPKSRLQNLVPKPKGDAFKAGA